MASAKCPVAYMQPSATRQVSKASTALKFVLRARTAGKGSCLLLLAQFVGQTHILWHTSVRMARVVGGSAGGFPRWRQRKRV